MSQEKRKRGDNRREQMKWGMMKENGQKGNDEVRQVKKRIKKTWQVMRQDEIQREETKLNGKKRSWGHKNRRDKWKRDELKWNETKKIDLRRDKTKKRAAMRRDDKRWEKNRWHEREEMRQD